MKAFADNNSNVTKMIISVFDRVENAVGKREIARNCLYKQFLIFPKCFQKASFQDPSKGFIVWDWVKVASGLERILYGVLVKRTPGNHG